MRAFVGERWSLCCCLRLLPALCSNSRKQTPNSSRITLFSSLNTCPACLDRKAENQMRAFARMTGGKLYLPALPEDYVEVFKDIGHLIRNQYSLSYHSTHKFEDGAYHKIKVAVLNADGRKSTYQVIARESYRAKRDAQ